jgi:hypothetical protein
MKLWYEFVRLNEKQTYAGRTVHSDFERRGAAI